VVALREDTFYGNIVAEIDGRTVNIDSRPSDALAIAVRAHVPILVTQSVMDTAGIIPEEDLQEGEEDVLDAPEAGSERLSVFEDFFDSMSSEPDDEENGDDDTE
jgi:bifunctional DNase/RNase